MNMNSATKRLAGIDEVGRGAFAGPLLAAGVFLTSAHVLKLQRSKLAIRDSKTLSEPQRERIFDLVCRVEIPFVTHLITVEGINKYGIGWANTTAIKACIAALHTDPVISTLLERGRDPVRISRHSVPRNDTITYIVDGRFRMEDIAVEGANIRCQVDADATELAVMLAGIIAKVTRDRMMRQLAIKFPKYAWDQNKGYGTAQHIEAIQKYGMTSHHRTIFIRKILN